MQDRVTCLLDISPHLIGSYYHDHGGPAEGDAHLPLDETQKQQRKAQRRDNKHRRACVASESIPAAAVALPLGGPTAAAAAATSAFSSAESVADVDADANVHIDTIAVDVPSRATADPLVVPEPRAMEPTGTASSSSSSSTDLAALPKKRKEPVHDSRARRSIPIVHFSEVKVPFISCVAMDRGGEFEKNLESLQVVSGTDYFLFS